MTGHITDGVGFIRNLKEHGVEVKGQEMVIIGTVFIEDLDNKEKLAEVVSESNILVNATRAGMAPLENVIPVPEERLRPELAVADVVYNLLETLLVKKEKFFNHFCISATKCSYNISSSLQNFYDLKCEIII